MSKVEARIFDCDLFGDPVRTTKKLGPLAERFLIPPFSVLNAREGAWQERKRAWLSIGLEGEVGSHSTSIKLESIFNSAEGRGGELHSGATINARNGDRYEGGRACWQNDTTSVFDPVVCELAYRWFCPAGGIVLDPFAGGSVRGIIATQMGRSYWGCDLRPEQIAANESQADQLCGEEIARPVWVCGDSREQLSEAPAEVDFVFSCPPYGDLEVYSELPGDISNMDWANFCEALGDIIAKSVERLKPNRFACFVVGDFRDPATGSYRGFPCVTTMFFLKAGLKLHNEAILVTSVGSLPVRVSKGFEVNRKMGKTHQNILLFVKGDPRKASAACESVPSY